MGKIRTVEIRKTCKECGKKLPNARFRTYCSTKCRRKAYNRKRSKAGYYNEYNRNKYSQHELGKIQCKICGGWYHKLGAHVVQRHGLTAREYRKEFGLDVKSGKSMVSEQHHKYLSSLAHGSHIERNLLIKGKKFRFKVGDKRAGKYERSPQTIERLKKQGKRTIINALHQSPNYIKHLENQK